MCCHVVQVPKRIWQLVLILYWCMCALVACCMFTRQVHRKNWPQAMHFSKMLVELGSWRMVSSAPVNSASVAVPGTSHSGAGVLVSGDLLFGVLRENILEIVQEVVAFPLIKLLPDTQPKMA